MKKEFIIFKTGRKEVRKLDLDTILYIRAEGSYTRIITITKEEILIANNLKQTTSNIKCTRLIKINRSTIVNIDKVKSFNAGKNSFLILINKEKLYPTKTHFHEINEKIATYDVI